MTPQSFCLRDFTGWVLLFIVSLAGVPIAQAAESVNSHSDLDHPCNPSSGPARPCPHTGPVGPVRPLAPGEIEKMKQDLDEAEREYQSRPKPVSRTGIIGPEIQAPFSSDYLIENHWHEIVNGENISVYAGSKRFEPSNDTVKYDPLTVHGFVIIIKGMLGQPNAKEKKIYTPTAVGSLHIIAANGTVLTLQSRQGNRFSFNVDTAQLTPLNAQ